MAISQQETTLGSPQGNRESLMTAVCLTGSQWISWFRFVAITVALSFGSVIFSKEVPSAQLQHVARPGDHWLRLLTPSTLGIGNRSERLFGDDHTIEMEFL